jgi:glycosyltransferase involved in cell wall biosynthesis
LIVSIDEKCCADIELRIILIIIGSGHKEKFNVAVFMTCFNNAKYLGQSIESVLSQDYKGSFHLFINDDASTDESPKILKFYQEKFPEKITLLLQTQNQFEKGKPIGIDLFKYSSSKYVAYCEADDFWHSKSKLKLQVRFMERNKWCGLVHSAIEIQEDSSQNEYGPLLRKHLSENSKIEKRISGKILTKTNFVMTCSVMLRRSEIPEAIIEEIGSLQPMDQILFALTARHSDIGFMRKKLATYRVHAENYWGNTANSKIKSDPVATQAFLDKYTHSA